MLQCTKHVISIERRPQMWLLRAMLNGNQHEERDSMVDTWRDPPAWPVKRCCRRTPRFFLDCARRCHDWVSHHLMVYSTPFYPGYFALLVL
jgi:hypothetical protein